MTLSVVIVSYNVKAFLEQCLNSVMKAAAGIETEIFVVDNRSVDGTQAMLRTKFSHVNTSPLTVRLILNDDNRGFSKANNQALRVCTGRYVLVLNPDTLLSEDTLQTMLAFMERDKTIGAAGCKLLNADGTFQLACRRSFPTPEVSFYKLVGLSRLFPKSPRFARYNLTYLSPDDTYEIDALMGAFMFLRREVLEGVGLFDESFFMYGEDLDWCFRIKAAGWKIFYYPQTQIVHYKGESTKLESFNYVVRFYEAMLIFVRKHYGGGASSKAFEWILITGIYLRASLAALRRTAGNLAAPVLDAALIAAAFIAGFSWKFQPEIPREFLGIVLPTYLLVWMATLTAFGQYREKNRTALKPLFSSIGTAFLLSTTLTFFFNQFAFSRIGLTASTLMAIVFLAGWRTLRRALTPQGFSGAIEIGRRVAIVGTGAEAQEIAAKLRADVSRNYVLMGYIAPLKKETGQAIKEVSSKDVTDEGIDDKEDKREEGSAASTETTGAVLGTLENVAEIVGINRIDELICAASELSNAEMLAALTRCSASPAARGVSFKIVPTGADVMIGKSSIDVLSGVPLVDVEYNLSRPSVQAVKRGFDLTLWLPLALLSPALWLAGHRHIFRSLKSVLLGEKTWVGVEREVSGFSMSGVYVGKRGVWSLASVQNPKPALPASDAEKEAVDLFYAKNSSVGLDLELLIKALLRRPK